MFHVKHSRQGTKGINLARVAAFFGKRLPSVLLGKNSSLAVLCSLVIKLSIRQERGPIVLLVATFGCCSEKSMSAISFDVFSVVILG